MSHFLSEPELAALRAVAEDVLQNHMELVYLPAVKLLALLDEVQASRQQQRWQPIATAPKRGHILLWCPFEAEGGNDWAWRVGEWWSAPGDPHWRYIDDKTGLYSIAHQPTLWMPLLPPSEDCGEYR